MRNITQFHKEKYHLLRLMLGRAEAVSEKFTDPSTAEHAATVRKGAAVTYTSVTREQKRNNCRSSMTLTGGKPPVRVHGEADPGLCQSLYEEKLLTYPRTDSQYLTSDMTETASCVIHLKSKVPLFDGISNFFPLVETLISDKEVSNHHAIILTMETEKTDLKLLFVGGRNLLLLV